MRNLLILFFILLGNLACASDSNTTQNENGKQYEIRHFTTDGAWTWFNDERVIIDRDILYIGSIDSQGRSRLDLFSFDSPFTALSPSEYIISSWKSKDDHNNPSLLKLADGKLLIAYSKHHVEPVFYWRTVNIDANERKLELQPEKSRRVQAQATYSNLFQLSDEKGRIYNFIRAIGFNPNFMYSDDMAATWQGPFELIRSGNSQVRPYVKYVSNGKDRIDFLYTDGHPRDIRNNNVYHLYYQGGSFYKSDGTLIRTFEQVKENPLIPSDGTRIYDGSSDTGRGWVWDLEYDKDGNPVAGYISSADDAVGNDLRYRYARWDEDKKEWLDNQIAFAGTNLYVPENHYAGGIAIDPENTGTVYISTDVDPVTGQKNSSGHYQIFRGKISSDISECKWVQLTFDTETDNIRPIVPREHGCEICLIWLQGQYKAYTDYNTSIVGIIEK